MESIASRWLQIQHLYGGRAQVHPWTELSRASRLGKAIPSCALPRFLIFTPCRGIFTQNVAKSTDEDDSMVRE